MTTHSLERSFSGRSSSKIFLPLSVMSTLDHLRAAPRTARRRGVVQMEDAVVQVQMRAAVAPVVASGTSRGCWAAVAGEAPCDDKIGQGRGGGERLPEESHTRRSTTRWT